MTKIIDWSSGSKVKRDATISETSRPPVTVDEVRKERDRRLEAGVTINVDGYGDIPVRGRQDDIAIYGNLQGAATLLTIGGDNLTTLRFRDRDNVVHLLTAPLVIELTTKAQRAATDIFAASWALIDGPDPSDPDYEIPLDFDDGEYWP